MASKRQMGYKCRIAGVMILLLASIAALVAVAVIQDAWAFQEYTLEVNKTPTHTHTHKPQMHYVYWIHLSLPL